MKSPTKGARLGKKLFDAIQAVDFAAARALVAAGADVHYASRDSGQSVAGATARLCNELFASADTVKQAQAPECLDLLRQLLAVGAKVPAGPFQTAAAFGNALLVELLLEHGTDVNELNDGTSAIFSAVTFGQQDIAVDLVRRGADPWVGEPLFACGPALHEAVVAGLDNVVRACVEQKVDLNHRGDVAVGEAPPTIVTKRRDASGTVTSTKFEVQPRPMAKNATVLNVAVRCGNLAMVELLLEGGADVEAADADGFTPLAWAVKLQRNDLADVLRAAGAKEAADLEGSPLFALVRACRQGDGAAVRAALARRPDVNTSYDGGSERFTPLMYAAKGGHDAIVAKLLAAGADPNRGGEDKDGYLNITPLMLAAAAGQATVVARLVEVGARLNAERGHVLNRFAPRSLAKRGRKTPADTALHQAAEAGHAEVVKLLVAAAAEAGQSVVLSSVVEAAAASGNTATMKAALDSKKKGRRTAAPSTATLVAAVESGNLESVRELLAAKANINGRTRRDETPLSSAVACRDLAMVKRLLAAGAQPATTDGKRTMTELVMAAASGDAPIMQLLLEAGANPNVAGNQGDTPLHLAAAFGFPDVVELLLAGGASTKLRNDNGQTPLEYVSKVLSGWIGQNLQAPQYRCRELLQRD